MKHFFILLAIITAIFSCKKKHESPAAAAGPDSNWVQIPNVTVTTSNLLTPIYNNNIYSWNNEFYIIDYSKGFLYRIDSSNNVSLTNCITSQWSGYASQGFTNNFLFIQGNISSNYSIPGKDSSAIYLYPLRIKNTTPFVFNSTLFSEQIGNIITPDYTYTTNFDSAYAFLISNDTIYKMVYYNVTYNADSTISGIKVKKIVNLNGISIIKGISINYVIAYKDKYILKSQVDTIYCVNADGTYNSAYFQGVSGFNSTLFVNNDTLFSVLDANSSYTTDGINWKAYGTGIETVLEGNITVNDIAVIKNHIFFMYSGSRNYSTNYELNIEQYNLKNGASQFYNTNGISSSILSGVLTATQTKVYFNGTLGGTGLYYKKLTDFK